jgi:hypothetical protein
LQRHGNCVALSPATIQGKPAEDEIKDHICLSEWLVIRQKVSGDHPTFDAQESTQDPRTIGREILSVLGQISSANPLPNALRGHSLALTPPVHRQNSQARVNESISCGAITDTLCDSNK